MNHIQSRADGGRKDGGKMLLRVRPRGFCAGVVRAVDIVELALEAYGPPVYVHHEIVHNRYVVDQLRQRGAIFVEAVSEVPQGAVLVFSAHGVPPTVREEAKARSLRVIDATCPLVTKVHLEALKFAREQRTIILIGHRDHQEIVTTPTASLISRRRRLACTTPRRLWRAFGSGSRRLSARPQTTSATPRRIVRRRSRRWREIWT